MSGPPPFRAATGQFSEEQQFAAQAAASQQRGGFVAGGRPGGRPGENAFAMSMMQPSESPYGAYGQGRPPPHHQSPYPHQRPPYGMPGQGGGYGHAPSPTEMAAAQAAYARQRAAYGYGPPSGASPDQRYHYGGPPGEGFPPGPGYFGHYGQQQRPSPQNSDSHQSSQGGPSPVGGFGSGHSPNKGGPSPQKPSPSSMSSRSGVSPLPTPRGVPRPSPVMRGSNSSSKAGPSPQQSTPGDSTSTGMTGTGSPPDGEEDDDGPLPVEHGGRRVTHSPGGAEIVESSDGQKWYSGSVPLGLEDDKYWLSELQVYLRGHFAECFGAKEEDIAAPMHGRNKPIALGQVGIRCMHCKADNPAERGQQATSYPSLISGIYNSVQQMLRLHLDCCLSMPPEVRQKIEQLKLSSSSRGGRKQYWIDSAKRLGLVDTPHGIHFGRDPHGPLPPLTGPSVNSKEGRKKKAELARSSPDDIDGEIPEADGIDSGREQQIPEVDPRPLVFPEDKALISDFLYLTLLQMSPCVLMEADRVGCYKTRKVGFPGLACRHCVGQAGCGRYFPASEASLSQTTTSQTIMNHVRNCRRCPVDIRENLEIMKRARMGPDGKRADKPKHGGRKVFFHRLWCRIQGIPVEEGTGDADDDEPKSGKKKKKGKKKKEKAEGDGEESDDAEGDDSGSEDEDSDEGDDDEGNASENTDAETPPSAAKGKAKSPKSSPSPKKAPLFVRCVRLTKSDDPNNLSDMECLARSELVEVFTYQKTDTLDGYGGRKVPAPGQVGIRCRFCNTLDPSSRPNGSVNFPESLNSVHTKVGDMIRLHFTSCPAMPDEFRDKVKALRGYDARIAPDDSQQEYWVDAARDIGLGNVPSDGSGSGWGITFSRDPLEPSPADDLDRETETPDESSKAFGKGSLTRAEDKDLCTDQTLLLLRHVKPCKFKKSDRRGGPGARGRDRVNGFPGLACRHCTTGRYFPVSAKNLTDSTVNSLQTHVASCTRVPEQVKASLAYLSHRSIHQKAQLSGSWKKTFFKKVWDRLHVERAWDTTGDDEADDDGEEADGAGGEPGDDDSAVAKEGAPAENGGGGDSETEDEEELGEGMNALIKAAAIWLTEQDGTPGGDASARSNRGRGRGLPNAKRPASASPKKSNEKGKGSSSEKASAAAPASASKRRRV